MTLYILVKFIWSFAGVKVIFIIKNYEKNNVTFTTIVYGIMW